MDITKDMNKLPKLILLSLGLFCVGVIVYFVYIMKQLSPVVEGLFPPGDECVYSEFLEERSGLEYEKGSDTPFTGVYTCVTTTRDVGYLTKSTYKNGKLDGPYVETFTYGGVGDYTRGQFRENTKIGVWKTFYENGVLRERFDYGEGGVNGVFEEFHPNGQLQSRKNYKNGILYGSYEYFDENGQLEFREEYKNGELIE